MFGSFGAIQAEATLHELDPRRAEQRRGDSDVDWGGSTSGLAEVEDSEEDNGGMLVDQDIGVNAMTAFVRSMCVGGQAHVSAGDLEDEARIRLEDADEEESASGSDGEEVDTELELADVVQGILAAEGEDEVASRSSSPEDDDDDTSEDEEVTPKRSFQARLERIRSRTVGRPIKDMMQEELDQALGLDDDLDSDSDSDIDGEDSIIAQIQVRESSPLFLSQRLMHRYRRASSMKTTISSALKIASRETASSERSTMADSRSTSMTLLTVHRVRALHTSSLTGVPPAHPCAFTRVLFLVAQNARETSTSLQNSTINGSATARRKPSASVCAS